MSDVKTILGPGTVKLEDHPEAKRLLSEGYHLVSVSDTPGFERWKAYLQKTPVPNVEIIHGSEPAPIPQQHQNPKPKGKK